METSPTRKSGALGLDENLNVEDRACRLYVECVHHLAPKDLAAAVHVVHHEPKEGAVEEVPKQRKEQTM